MFACVVDNAPQTAKATTEVEEDYLGLRLYLLQLSADPYQHPETELSSLPAPAVQQLSGQKGGTALKLKIALTDEQEPIHELRSAPTRVPTFAYYLAYQHLSSYPRLRALSTKERRAGIKLMSGYESISKENPRWLVEEICHNIDSRVLPAGRIAHTNLGSSAHPHHLVIYHSIAQYPSLVLSSNLEIAGEAPMLRLVQFSAERKD